MMLLLALLSHFWSFWFQGEIQSSLGWRHVWVFSGRLGSQWSLQVDRWLPGYEFLKHSFEVDSGRCEYLGRRRSLQIDCWLFVYEAVDCWLSFDFFHADSSRCEYLGKTVVNTNDCWLSIWVSRLLTIGRCELFWGRQQSLWIFEKDGGRCKSTVDYLCTKQSTVDYRSTFFKQTAVVVNI